MNIATIREKYPQYADLPDKQLVDALHDKYYKDIPLEQFYAKVGLIQTAPANENVTPLNSTKIIKEQNNKAIVSNSYPSTAQASESTQAKLAIQKKVERSWVRPVTANKDLKCTVKVRLMSDGTVISADVISSSGDEIFDRSVENAVEKSSPLPVPNDKELFAEEFRTFQFLFNPSPVIAKIIQRENTSNHLEVSSTKSSFLENDQATGGLTYIASSVIFGLVVFYVLTKGLKGKEKDSATNLGRWYGSTTTMLYLCSGGAKLTILIHNPEGWFLQTLMLTLAWFGIGYIAGLIKWHWSNKSKQKPKDPPPYNESTHGRYKDENTSQNESHDHYKNRANAKKGHSFEERLEALRDNIDLCFAILDLDNMASPSEIKAAFKKKMSGYHPDKVSGLGDKLKQVAEEETKLINIAYNILKKLGYTK
jgi:TonB family protein